MFPMYELPEAFKEGDCNTPEFLIRASFSEFIFEPKDYWPILLKVGGGGTLKVLSPSILLFELKECYACSEKGDGLCDGRGMGDFLFEITELDDGYNSFAEGFIVIRDY